MLRATAVPRSGAASPAAAPLAAAVAAALSLLPAPALAFGETVAVTYKGTRVCVGGGPEKVSFQGTIRIDANAGAYPVTILDDEVGSYPEPPRANWEPITLTRSGFGFGGFDIPLSEPAGNTTRLDVWTGTASVRSGTVEITKLKGLRTILSFQKGAACQAVLKFSGKAGDVITETSRSGGGAAGAGAAGAPGGS